MMLRIPAAVWVPLRALMFVFVVLETEIGCGGAAEARVRRRVRTVARERLVFILYGCGVGGVGGGSVWLRLAGN
jgi:hypothetical protein